VRGNPGNWVDPKGEETTVYISYPQDNPFDPGHAFLSTESTIYDPSGAECVCQYDPDALSFFPGGSNQTYSRDPKTDTKFFGHAKSDGYIVNAYRFPKTYAEELQIETRIEEHGGGGYLGCAASVSSVLHGIGPFEDLGSFRFPSSLEARLKEMVK
jgi:hypothetical protein